MTYPSYLQTVPPLPVTYPSYLQTVPPLPVTYPARAYQHRNNEVAIGCQDTQCSPAQNLMPTPTPAVYQPSPITDMPFEWLLPQDPSVYRQPPKAMLRQNPGPDCMDPTCAGVSTYVGAHPSPMYDPNSSENSGCANSPCAMADCQDPSGNCSAAVRGVPNFACGGGDCAIGNEGGCSCAGSSDCNCAGGGKGVTPQF